MQKHNAGSEITLDFPTRVRSGAGSALHVGLLLSASLLTGCAGSTELLGKLSLAGSPASAPGHSASQPAAPGGWSTSLAGGSAEAKAALKSAQQLKAAGKLKEALATLDGRPESAEVYKPLLVEHGLIALELGKAERARQLLLRAGPNTAGDWRVFSGLGIASSSLGRHQEAQGYFAKALALSPNNPTVLNNMAMSYILEQKLAQAEPLLQRASKAKAPPVRATSNLALVQALRAETGVAGERPVADASAEARVASNVAAPEPPLVAAVRPADAAAPFTIREP